MNILDVLTQKELSYVNQVVNATRESLRITGQVTSLFVLFNEETEMESMPITFQNHKEKNAMYRYFRSQSDKLNGFCAIQLGEANRFKNARDYQLNRYEEVPIDKLATEAVVAFQVELPALLLTGYALINTDRQGFGEIIWKRHVFGTKDINDAMDLILKTNRAQQTPK